MWFAYPYISETDSSQDVRLQASQMLQVFNCEGENRLLTVLDKLEDTICSAKH